MANEKRLIDANSLGIGKAKREAFNDPVYADGWNSAIDIIENAPTVDAVEVVRCKDCKYYTENQRRCDHPCLDFDVECFDHWLEMEPNDFCSYGERREGE